MYFTSDFPISQNWLTLWVFMLGNFLFPYCPKLLISRLKPFTFVFLQYWLQIYASGKADCFNIGSSVDIYLFTILCKFLIYCPNLNRAEQKLQWHTLHPWSTKHLWMSNGKSSCTKHNELYPTFHYCPHYNFLRIV